jgi:hypothetical protein
MPIYQRKYSNIELKISADVLHGVSADRVDIGSGDEDANIVTADAAAPRSINRASPKIKRGRSKKICRPRIPPWTGRGSASDSNGSANSVRISLSSLGWSSCGETLCGDPHAADQTISELFFGTRA